MQNGKAKPSHQAQIDEIQSERQRGRERGSTTNEFTWELLARIDARRDQHSSDEHRTREDLPRWSTDRWSCVDEAIGIDTRRSSSTVVRRMDDLLNSPRTPSLSKDAFLSPVNSNFGGWLFSSESTSGGSSGYCVETRRRNAGINGYECSKSWHRRTTPALFRSSSSMGSSLRDGLVAIEKIPEGRLFNSPFRREKSNDDDVGRGFVRQRQSWSLSKRILLQRLNMKMSEGERKCFTCGEHRWERHWEVRWTFSRRSSVSSDQRRETRSRLFRTDWNPSVKIRSSLLEIDSNQTDRETEKHVERSSTWACSSICRICLAWTRPSYVGLLMNWTVCWWNNWISRARRALPENRERESCRCFPRQWLYHRWRISERRFAVYRCSLWDIWSSLGFHHRDWWYFQHLRDRDSTRQSSFVFDLPEEGNGRFTGEVETWVLLFNGLAIGLIGGREGGVCIITAVGDGWDGNDRLTEREGPLLPIDRICCNTRK